MRIAMLVLAGCAATYDPVEPTAIDDAWRLDGDARIDNGAVAMQFCCMAWGAATKPLTVPAGRTTIAIEHANTECRTGTLAFARVGGQMASFARLDAGSGGGTARLELDLDHAEAIELRVGTEGGLHCCGTTTIGRVEIQ